jgi:hypothetical protein
MTDWRVGITQNKPFEYFNLEIFAEECDAIRYAETYMQGRAGRRTSKRRWLMIQNDGPDLILTVWKD